jgi:hypothetical protein
MPHETPFPFGVLANHNDLRFQLGVAAIVVIIADLVLAGGKTFSPTTLGAALWDLLLSATVANAAPETLRSTAFGIYKLTTGLAMFVASVVAGALFDGRRRQVDIWCECYGHRLGSPAVVSSAESFLKASAFSLNLKYSSRRFEGLRVS